VQVAAPGACPIERNDMSRSTSIRTATVAAALAGFTALGGLVVVPVVHATPVVAPQQGFGVGIAKYLLKVNWQKEFKDATKGVVVQVVLDKVIEILVPKGGSNTIPVVQAGSINNPDMLISRSSNPAGVSPRVSYVKSNDARGLFNSTLKSGGIRQSENSYKVGVQTVKFSPGTSSAPPSITISNSAVTNKIVVLAN
jgi:hypothetical protein